MGKYFERISFCYSSYIVDGCNLAQNLHCIFIINKSFKYIFFRISDRFNLSSRLQHSSIILNRSRLLNGIPQTPLCLRRVAQMTRLQFGIWRWRVIRRQLEQAARPSRKSTIYRHNYCLFIRDKPTSKNYIGMHNCRELLFQRHILDLMYSKQLVFNKPLMINYF